MGAENKAFGVFVVIVVAVVASGLLYWVNVRDIGVFGFVACIAVFAIAYLLGRRRRPE
jgi:hypothetical protein